LNAAVQEPLVQETLDGELETVPEPDMETVRFCAVEVSELPSPSPPPPPQPINAAASRVTRVLDAKAPKLKNLIGVDPGEFDINYLEGSNMQVNEG
jgi:hypothetical protein